LLNFKKLVVFLISGIVEVEVRLTHRTVAILVYLIRTRCPHSAVAAARSFVCPWGWYRCKNMFIFGW
jgi:hypothetical protein